MSHEREHDENPEQAKQVILEHEGEGDLIAEQLTQTEDGIVVEQLRRVGQSENDQDE